MPNEDIAILNPFNAMPAEQAIMVAVCGMVVVFLMLIILALVIRINSKLVMLLENKKEAAPAPAAKPAAAPAPAPAAPTDGAIAGAWNSFLAGVPRYKLRQLQELKKTYRILLLSNTNELHWDWALLHDFTQEGHTPADYFDDIYLSFRLHLAKPAPEIFAEVIRRSGILPEETLFIDDSPANCRAAEAFGIRTFTPPERADWASGLFPGLCGSWAGAPH